MTYFEAKQWRDSHKDLIGTIDNNGFHITDLIIVPTNELSRRRFFNDFLFTYYLSKEELILPYSSEDMQVWSIDMDRFHEDNFLFYDVLAK